MRILITGGAGFLGSHLCDRYLAEGNEVVCFDNLITGQRGNVAALEGREGFRFVSGSVTDEAALRALGKADLVLHFASPASPIDYLKVPLETVRAGSTGTWNLLELARQWEARFLLASTSEVYGDPLVHPQPESYWGNVNPIGVRSVYDESKRFSEMLASLYRRKYATDTAIVRIFNTYGPRMRADDGRVVPNFVLQALRGEALTVYGDGLQTRSFCYYSDLIEGIVRAAASGEHDPINLGNPHEVTMVELAETVSSLVGRQVRVEYRPLPQDDPTRRCPDIARARAVLGWAPTVRLREGLTSTIGWFEANRDGGPR
jgi:dTDP-glucose 4,6-dehydratase